MLGRWLQSLSVVYASLRLEVWCLPSGLPAHNGKGHGPGSGGRRGWPCRAWLSERAGVCGEWPAGKAGRQSCFSLLCFVNNSMFISCSLCPHRGRQVGGAAGNGVQEVAEFLSPLFPSSWQVGWSLWSLLWPVASPFPSLLPLLPLSPTL